MPIRDKKLTVEYMYNNGKACGLLICSQIGVILDASPIYRRLKGKLLKLSKPKEGGGVLWIRLYVNGYL